jgi:hypothetical protein
MGKRSVHNLQVAFLSSLLLFVLGVGLQPTLVQGIRKVQAFSCQSFDDLVAQLRHLSWHSFEF